MDVEELTLVEVQALCQQDEHFRLAFEAWWKEFKERHNVIAQIRH